VNIPTLQTVLVALQGALSKLGAALASTMFKSATKTTPAITSQVKAPIGCVANCPFASGNNPKSPADAAPTKNESQLDNLKLIEDTAIADGIPKTLAMLIAAQSVHETGNFTSSAFTKDNNGFGYKYVEGAKWQVQDKGITSSEGDNYAKYENIEDSVHELTAWIKRRQAEGKFPQDLNTITNPDIYAKLLKNDGYYGDAESVYASGIHKTFDKMI